MSSEENVKLCVEKVPACIARPLCRSINKAARTFFADPKNKADFEAWHAIYLAGKEGAA